MNPRFIVYFLYVAFALLILNIWAYYKSDAYREFIDTIKYGEQFISDEYRWPQDSSWSIVSTGTLIFTGQTQSATGQSVTWSQNKVWLPALLPSEEKILGLFDDYKLKRLLVHPSMFNLTTEFPDDYYEYYSPELTLYILSTKNYRETVNIFEAMATELPFFINKTNSFGTNSFFINVKSGFEDEYVRFIFEYDQKVFWLKIQKKLYNTIRDTIKNFEKREKAS